MTFIFFRVSSCRVILRVFQGFVKRIHYWLIPELYELPSSLSLKLKEDLKISIISKHTSTPMNFMKVLGQAITRLMKILIFYVKSLLPNNCQPWSHVQMWRLVIINRLNDENERKKIVDGQHHNIQILILRHYCVMNEFFFGSHNEWGHLLVITIS